MDGDFRFNLEALAHDGHGFHEGAVHGPVAGHHVFETVAVHAADHPAHQVVAETVEGTLVLFLVAAVGDAVAHRHVRLVLGQRTQKLRRAFGGVGVVAVHHEVVAGLDFAEHLAHHVALALARLMGHDSPRFRRQAGGVVGRVVVVHVNPCQRQHSAEIGHHLGNGDFFVVTGNENGHVLAFEHFLNAGGVVRGRLSDGFRHQRLLPVQHLLEPVIIGEAGRDAGRAGQSCNLVLRKRRRGGGFAG